MTDTPISLADGLFQLSFLLQARLAEVAAAYDLSLAQVRLLGILRDREPGMLELSRYLLLEKSSLSGLVDRAEARGLVERLPSAQDKRAARVRLTARGRRLARKVEEQVGAEVAALLEVLPGVEQTRLAALVARVVIEAGRGGPIEIP